MIKIKLNQEEFEILSFARTIYFSSSGTTNNGNCELVESNISKLEELSQSEITSLQIYNGNELIYDLQNVNIKLEFINEALSDGHMVNTLNFVFL